MKAHPRQIVVLSSCGQSWRAQLSTQAVKNSRMEVKRASCTYVWLCMGCPLLRHAHNTHGMLRVLHAVQGAVNFAVVSSSASVVTLVLFQVCESDMLAQDLRCVRYSSTIAESTVHDSLSMAFAEPIRLFTPSSHTSCTNVSAHHNLEASAIPFIMTGTHLFPVICVISCINPQSTTGG